MDNAQTLADRITALAAEPVEHDGRARVLKGPATELLLDEIDATVLPANLTFRAGGNRLGVSVAGRRLHTVTEMVGDFATSSELLGMPLAMDDTDLRAQAARALSSFAEGAAGQMTVETRPGDPSLSEVPDSVSVPSLRQDMGLNTSAMAPHERFEAKISETVSACILLNDGAIQKTSGSVAHTASLKVAVTTQLSRFLSVRQKNCPSHKDPSITTFADAIEPGQSIFVATFGAITIIAAVETPALSTIFSAFRRV